MTSCSEVLDQASSVLWRQAVAIVMHDCTTAQWFLIGGRWCTADYVPSRHVHIEQATITYWSVNEIKMPPVTNGRGHSPRPCRELPRFRRCAKAHRSEARPYIRRPIPPHAITYAIKYAKKILPTTQNPQQKRRIIPACKCNKSEPQHVRCHEANFCTLQNHPSNDTESEMTKKVKHSARTARRSC